MMTGVAFVVFMIYLCGFFGRVVNRRVDGRTGG